MSKNDALTLTSQMLNSCKSPGEIVDLPAVEQRWINTYEMTTGRNDGALKFHAEKVLFMQTIAESTQLAKCTPMSIYSSFILLAVSGLSLKDGQSYLIPYKDKAVWMPGWKGRLEQISQIRGVEYLAEPVCVFEGEEFEHEIVNGEIHILRHKPLLNTVGKQILAVYATLKMINGNSRIFMMKREEVLSIRDNYSRSYNDYMSVAPNKDGKRMKQGKYGDYEVEAPMWVTDEVQAFKKTLVKRIYNTLSKEGGVGRFTYVDGQISEMTGGETVDVDPEDFAKKVNEVAGVEDAVCEDVSEPEPAAETVATTPDPEPVKASTQSAKLEPQISAKIDLTEDDMF